jgi:hypothetical protein
MKHIRYRINGEVKQVEGQLDSGVVDRNGTPIFEGDTLRFENKWEWWRGLFGGGMLATRADYEEVLNDHVKYPYEDRLISLPDDYEWLMSREIQSYWEVIKSLNTRSGR